MLQFRTVILPRLGAMRGETGEKRGREEMTKVLVAGGCGFIGSVLVTRLMCDIRNPRYNSVESVVHVIDNLRYGCGHLVSYMDKPHFKLFNGSILDRSLLKKLFSETRYDCVVHLAAMVGDPLCAKYPELAEEVNVEGTVRLLEASKDASVPLFVHSSTCSTYGMTSDLADETTELNPQSIYAKSKVVAERYVESYPNSYIIFRNATVYGLSGRTRLDIIPNQWIKDASLSRPIEVYEPEGIRPFIHIQDCVEYFTRAINCPQTVKRKQIFNVGDCNVTKRQLALTVQEFFPKTEIKIVERGDRRSYCVDFSKARREFNYTPQISLYEGISKMSKSLGCLGNLDNPVYDNVEGFKT